MRIAFVGKGGSGKTTLSSLFCRFLATHHMPVLAIDADINQHLGTALGLADKDLETMPMLGLEVDRVKDFLRGSNPRISTSIAMIKTTPPGHGSRLLSLQGNNPLLSYFQREIYGVRFVATGPFEPEDLGVKCYHSKVGTVEMILNHMIDTINEYIIVDMTAGADSFASGLFTKFDLTVVVVEPTRKSLSVYQQYNGYAHDYNVQIRVIGNKIESEDDIHFLRNAIGQNFLGWFEQSSFVRTMEKGRFLPFEHLESHNQQVLAIIQQTVDQVKKDWNHFYQQSLEFHRKNALGWANTTMQQNLLQQIDPTFQLADFVQTSSVATI